MYVVDENLTAGFFLAIFSKLKGGKTQRFSKLKQFFAKLKENILKLNISEIFVVVDLFSILQIK